MPEARRVARSGAKLRAIATTALQETLRRKVLYVVLVLVLLIGLIVGSSTVLLQMAAESGEAGVAESVRSSVVASALGIWSTASSFLAVFLGAIALSTEVTGKTIVNVLSRPVDRAVYLTGRWIGVLAFLWMFQAIGIVIGIGVGLAFHVPLPATLWLGLAATLVNGAFLSGVSLGFSVAIPPVLAGICAFLIQIIPAMVKDAVGSPHWAAKLPAMAAYYLAPAVMPVNLIADSFSKQMLHPDYGLYARVITENLLYAIVVFAVAALVFRRRELRLR
jgi:ABC-type transport system involved in multi-copper enzyme maturation permease subunit